MNVMRIAPVALFSPAVELHFFATELVGWLNVVVCWNIDKNDELQEKRTWLELIAKVMRPQMKTFNWTRPLGATMPFQWISVALTHNRMSF